MSETTVELEQEVEQPTEQVVVTEQDPSDPQFVAAQLKAEREANQTAQAEYARRLQAERERANRAEQQAQVAGQDREALQLSTISTALDAANARAEQVKGDLARAFEVGDYKMAAEAQAELGRLAARMETLETGKSQFEQQRQQQLSQPQAQQPQPDPIEADLAKRDPQSAAWIRKQVDAQGQPRFYTDQRFQQKVIGAHNLALADGLAVNSPEYFDFVERTAGVAQQNNQGPAPVATQQRAAVPTAAPVRQSGNPTQPRQMMSNHIPAEAAKWAKQIGVDPADYWKEVQEMDRKGEFKLGNPWRKGA